MAHKAAVVRTLMHRASTLSSNSVERVVEEKKVMVIDVIDEGHQLSLFWLVVRTKFLWYPILYPRDRIMVMG